MKKIKAVIFDLDGTLIDTEPVWHEAEIRVFAELGVKLTEQNCLETVGVRIDRVVEYWREKFPWTGKSNQEVADEVCKTVQKIVAERGVLKDGALEAIQYFSELGLPLAIASASPKFLIESNIKALKIDQYFKIVHSAEHEINGKPDPAVFLSTAKLLAISPEKCLVFEDSLHGITAAKRAGMTCVAVKEHATNFEKACELADFGIESFLEITKDCKSEHKIGSQFFANLSL